tara:strand:- start:556 stop:759 length:204 start_codon:yes stop_codon:yes gene_type:complete
MKPGMAVELSAYGNKRKFLKKIRGRIGLLLHVKKWKYGYGVIWSGMTTMLMHSRREIKILKSQKESE